MGDAPEENLYLVQPKLFIITKYSINIISDIKILEKFHLVEEIFVDLVEALQLRAVEVYLALT